MKKKNKIKNCESYYILWITRDGLRCEESFMSSEKELWEKARDYRMIKRATGIRPKVIWDTSTYGPPDNMTRTYINKGVWRDTQAEDDIIMFTKWYLEMEEV